MQEMYDRINNFLDSRGIEDELFRNLISGFIIKHTELYGDVVSFDELMTRLDTNLKQIKWHDPSEIPNELEGMVGQYVGFDDNSIHMYFYKSVLRNPQILEDFKSVFLHELTHCAYDIKNNDYYKTESQVFCTMQQKLGGKVDVVSGTEIFMEPIINYISSTIEGKKNSAYVPQTLRISQLATIIGQDNIIYSAFYSDENTFKSCFDIFNNDAYEYFAEGISWLNHGGETGFRRGNEILNNFFSGNIPVLSNNKREFQEIENTDLKSINTDFFNNQIEPEKLSKNRIKKLIKTLKKNGFVNSITLSLIVMIVGIVILLLVFFYKL